MEKENKAIINSKGIQHNKKESAVTSGNLIDNDEVLKNDLGISTAPPNSPSGIPKPAKSDFVLYIPHLADGSDTCNQHVTVLPLPTGEFLATWTMGSLEGGNDQHIVISRSVDGCKTWSEPEYFAGPKDDGFIASWSFPFMVPHTGRIYMFYNKHRGIVDFHHQWTGQLWFRYSDDFGYTWSKAYTHLRIERNSYSHSHPEMDPNWIAYQPPIITSAGDVMVGFTHVATKALEKENYSSSEVRFLRFDNILTEQDAAKLKVTTLPANGADGLRIEDPRFPGMSLLQEATIQNLSDGRLFSVMRSATGFVIYSISEDNGATWSKPEPLRYFNGGDKVRHPIIPCPLYKLRDNRFILVFHNNCGDANHGRHVSDWCRNRRPVYLAIGRELPHAQGQPIIFKKPVLLADNDRIPISRKQLTEIGTYTSLFELGDKVYFFFPDRKHFLLGKILSDNILDDSGLPK